MDQPQAQTKAPTETQPAEAREETLEKLLEIARQLPDDKLAEALDFVEYLHTRYVRHRPKRGSPEAILKHAGKLCFEPGELDRLLDEIEQMRLMDMEDMEEHG